MCVGNEISDEEKEWMRKIDEAVKAEGLMVENRFMLAAYAIVSKGDVAKALHRIRNWNRIVTTHRINETSEKEATQWFKVNMVDVFYSVGRDAEGMTGYGIRNGNFRPDKVVTDDDLRCFLRGLSDNLKSNTMTIEDVRRGSFFMGDMSTMAWENFNLNLQKKMVGVLQDSFPIKLKRLVFVNPPSFIWALIKIMSVFMKKKLVDRIKPIQMSDVPQLFSDTANVPAHMGGGMTLDAWEKRENQLKIYRASVAEVESGGGPRAATVAM